MNNWYNELQVAEDPLKTPEAVTSPGTGIRAELYCNGEGYFVRPKICFLHM